MDVGVILAVAIVCVAIGYFAGLILTNLKKDRSSPIPGSEVSNTGDTGPRYEADRLTMVLWSKTPDGPLFADIDNHSISSPTELSVQERVRVDKALNDFQMWLGRPILRSGKTGTLPPAQDNETLPQIEPTVIPEFPLESIPTDPEMIAQAPIETIEEPLSTAVPAQSEAAGTITGETFSEVKPVPPVISFRPSPKPAASAPKSIVEQINDILQVKVKDSPLANAGIVLQETPKGVIVWVGKESYQGVDTLPEGDAKKIIRAAVAEWEKK